MCQTSSLPGPTGYVGINKLMLQLYVLNHRDFYVKYHEGDLIIKTSTRAFLTAPFEW